MRRCDPQAMNLSRSARSGMCPPPRRPPHNVMTFILPDGGEDRDPAAKRLATADPDGVARLHAMLRSAKSAGSSLRAEPRLEDANGRDSGKKIERARHRAARAGRSGRQLRPVRAHRQSAHGFRPDLPRRRRQARRQGTARRRRFDRGRAKGGARLRGQSAGPGQGRARRSRQGFARGAARRLREFGAGLPRRRRR